jgi:hypothetical protein
MAFRAYLQAGVSLVLGKAYHILERLKGWMRVSTVTADELEEGVSRIQKVYQILVV